MIDHDSLLPVPIVHVALEDIVRDASYSIRTFGYHTMFTHGDRRREDKRWVQTAVRN